MAKGLRIAVFGTSLVSGYENAAGTYSRGIVRALVRRGHVVRFYEPDIPERLAHRDIVDPPWAEIVRFPTDGEGVETALERASDADVLVKFSGIGVFDDLLDAALPHCAIPPTISVYWDIDPAATLERLENEANYPLRAQLPWYDLVLTRYGGETVVEAFQQFGARTCFPIYNAFDPDVHYPVAADPNQAASMVFLSHRASGEREAQVRRNFLHLAGLLPSRRFVLGGCGWDDVPMPANIDYVGYAYTAEHNLLYRSATAVLNLTRPAAARCGYAPSARLFEAAGAAACLISDSWPGLESFFEPEREVLIAGDVTEIVEQLCGLSAERAAAIGRRAYERARLEHTYERRAAELEALLEGFDRHWADRTAL